MTGPPAWEEISLVDRGKVVDRLFDFFYDSLERAEWWANRGDHRRWRKNVERNLRRAEVHYAAVRRLDCVHWWPKYEARLAKLRAMIRV